jgi:hypothetical protein
MMPTTVGTTIIERVQQACEIMEEIGGQIKVENNDEFFETKHPQVDLGLEHPIEVELNNVDNLATLQEACIPLYQGARCIKFAATMPLIHM